MQNLYTQTTSLDQRARVEFALSEVLMMEHAAMGMERIIRERFPHNSTILIVCGPGNNGADGRILARLLEGDYTVFVKHESHQRYDVIVDALFGSGLARSLDSLTQELINTLNKTDAFKIACDVPTGLYANGALDTHVFKADVTVAMGALKLGMFSDAAKEVVGEIHVCDLGISRVRYEVPSPWQLLDLSDLQLPNRTHTSTHKGSYGHLSLICGEKIGASVIAGSAALRFGSGLVSLITCENIVIPHELMQSHSLPSTTTAITLGMGLGTEFCDEELQKLLDNTHPLVLDADIFAHPLFATLLDRHRTVITPHPKEFAQVLRLTGIADIDVTTLQNDRFTYAQRFCSAFPNTVLVLKGANVIIGSNDRFYINPHGTVALAKGGSGDVLSGLIGALLAQGYMPLDAAIHASLAHTLGAQKFTKNNYALTPFDLIESITTL
ncbi:MAG TPA: NAD(P)H-hydrate dehydratase [Sulfuricurvum sp.]|nr:MAG: NAD(P)H-hydrate dehydratase [Campylobacterales bacterium 16-40-21]OZA02174.1 MAG: NAD(P)H-hydrate dehydratase [Sulfuricurvum sp. 17-40-25]HQS66686.1 NAD(P)H-hydrate dehydratase [Sulfuricurvum sp.]HQT37215.1 NAD(P)H-hydrate dehydratase [Sulfuricurvum sp.]